MDQQHNEGTSGIEAVQTEAVIDLAAVQTAEVTDTQVDTSTDGNENISSSEPVKPANDAGFKGLDEKEVRRIKGLLRSNGNLKDSLAERDAMIEDLSNRMNQYEQSLSQPVEPDRDSYDDDSAYIRDLSKYEANKIINARDAEANKQAQAQQRQQQANRNAQVQMQQQIDIVRNAVPDYDAKIQENSDIQLPTGTNDILAKMGSTGAAITYLLANDRSLIDNLYMHDGNPAGIQFQLQSLIPDAMNLVRNGGKTVPSAALAPAPKVLGNNGAKKINITDPSMSTKQRIEMWRKQRTGS